MKKKKPLISIILPVFNSSKNLKDTLKSISCQSEKRLEIIAIDDFSKDDSFKILKQYKKREKKLRVYKNIKRYGWAITLNRAVRRAKGKFIAFVNPGDLSTKQRFAKQLKFLLENPKVVAVGTQCIYVNRRNKRAGKSLFPLDYPTISKTLLPALSMQFETALINRKALPKDILKFHKNSYPSIYTDIFMKFIHYGELANLNEYLCFHQKDIESQSKLEIVESLLSLIKLWLKSIAVYEHRPSLRSFFETTRVITNL